MREPFTDRSLIVPDPSGSRWNKPGSWTSYPGQLRLSAAFSLLGLNSRGQTDRVAQAWSRGSPGRISPSPASWHDFHSGIFQVFSLHVAGVFIPSRKDSPDSFSPAFRLDLGPAKQQRRWEDD